MVGNSGHLFLVVLNTGDGILSQLHEGDACELTPGRGPEGAVTGYWLKCGRMRIGTVSYEAGRWGLTLYPDIAATQKFINKIWTRLAELETK